MPLYENVFLVRPDVSASQVEALAKEFSTIIEEGGGTVPKIEQWGLRTLAYRLKKNRKAHYVLMNLDAPTGAVHEMERNMRTKCLVALVLVLVVEKCAADRAKCAADHGADQAAEGGGAGSKGKGKSYAVERGPLYKSQWCHFCYRSPGCR